MYRQQYQAEYSKEKAKSSYVQKHGQGHFYVVNGNAWQKHALPLSGAVLLQKALDFVCVLGCNKLKTSSGLLKHFKDTHSIVGIAIRGEYAEVNAIEATDWLWNCVPGILACYNTADIYNANEMTFSYCLFPTRPLALRNERCRSGKQSKQRLTTLVCVNTDGSDKPSHW